MGIQDFKFVELQCPDCREVRWHPRSPTLDEHDEMWQPQQSTIFPYMQSDLCESCRPMVNGTMPDGTYKCSMCYKTSSVGWPSIHKQIQFHENDPTMLQLGDKQIRCCDCFVKIQKLMEYLRGKITIDDLHSGHTINIGGNILRYMGIRRLGPADKES